MKLRGVPTAGAAGLIAVLLLAACGTRAAHATAVPTPKPVPGHVVFVDNFSNTRSGWRNDIVLGHGGYIKGGYALAGYAAEREYVPSPYWSTKVRGIRIDADVVESHGDAGTTWYGVGCGDQRDRDPEYEFLVSADGEYLVDRRGSLAVNVLASGRTSMGPLGTANHLEASCIPVTFTDHTTAVYVQFSVNGTVLANETDEAFADALAWTGGLMTSSWEASTIGVVFHRFSITDEAPLSLPTPSLPRVVYRDLLHDPLSGWTNTNVFAPIHASFSGDQWRFQAPAAEWAWVSAPFNGQDVSAVTASVTPTYIDGGTLAEAGVVCTDAATYQPLFAFFEDGEGDWEIDSVDSSGSSSVLRSGVTTFVGGDISGTCAPGHGNTTLLVLAVGGLPVGTASAPRTASPHWGGGVAVSSAPGDSAATFAFSDFSLTRLPTAGSPVY